MMNSYNDYNERLSSLDSELKTYSIDIINHISSIYSPPPPTTSTTTTSSSINLKNDPRNLLKLFQHDINELLSYSNENINSNSNSNIDINKCSDIINDLNSLIQLNNTITLCEENITNDNILSSCKLFNTMDNCINDINKNNNISENYSKVINILIKEAHIVKSRFISRLHRLLKHCLQFEDGRVIVIKSLKGQS